MAWQGLCMAESAGPLAARDGVATPMAAVGGPDAARLAQTVATVAASLPESASPVIALRNTRSRHVVSGPVPGLLALQSALGEEAVREARAHREGRHAGQPLRFTWEWLDVAAPYHSPSMAAGLQRMQRVIDALVFRVPATSLGVPVLSPATALPYAGDRIERDVIADEFTGAVLWPDTVRRLAECVASIVDCGPGDGVARLTASVVRGSGVRVLAASTEEGERILEGASPLPEADDWRRFAPTLARLPDGTLVVDNLFARATGQPPVLLPGMTPTTSDAGIVAAAANAGFWSELAGGGQPTQQILDARLAELRGILQPGRGIVVNTLHLDPNLWELHVRSGALVRARRAGGPIDGITVSAGIPELEEATRLVAAWNAAGIRRIAFKPGTAGQIEQVLRVADAVPDCTIFLQVEGGLAGGHHSWEDLDTLLIETYPAIRARRNVVLCAGGGIADEARAVELLTGEWSRRYGVAAMPVDAVFIGTLAMATREATASPSVKRALAAAAGAQGPVLAGDTRGGVTSGKSQLGADIHYLDTHAARVGRLLDSIAGDAAAIRARHAEIATALAHTAKPWFGDPTAMSWLQFLSRAAELMATGRGGRHDDGVWPDVSFRSRFSDLVRLAESRLATAGTMLDSLVADPRATDAPATLIERIAARFPDAGARRLGPADAERFVAICARPGKPVPFTPVIDADVRRWYKADALWQAQDDRFDADQVLVLPGPAALSGLRSVDEPIADLLGRFERAVIDALLAAGKVPALVERLSPPLPPSDWGIGDEVNESPSAIAARATAHGATSRWADLAATRFRGPLAAAFAELPCIGLPTGSENPLRRLLRAEIGATLRLEHREHELRLLRWTRPSGEFLEVRLAEAAPARAPAELDSRLHVEMGVASLDGTHPLRWTMLHRRLVRGHEILEVDRESFTAGVQALYAAALLDGGAEPVALFDAARELASIDPERAVAWSALTGGPLAAAGGVHIDLAFGLAWRALFRVLACPELRGGWLHLLHAAHRVELEPGASLPVAQQVHVLARVVRVDDSGTGRGVRVLSRLSFEGRLIATLTTDLMLRQATGALPAHTEAPACGEVTFRSSEPLRELLALPDTAAREFLASHDWIRPLSGAALAEHDRVRLDCRLLEQRDSAGGRWFGASGSLFAGDEEIARIELGMERSDAAEHPVRILVALFGTGDGVVATPRSPLAAHDRTAPSEMTSFSEVGGDRNPIHRSDLAARLAGLPAPIVHGMWTSATLHALAAEAAGAALSDVRAVDAAFLAPVSLGEPLRFSADRVGVRGGERVIEATASALRDGGTFPVARTRLRLSPPLTAWVFPGQGIQKQGMGMEGFARSRAARSAWERADAFTRDALDFSILHVVRSNPRLLHVKGERLTHPEGVLHLTQFTQVAMAALAIAQVAELREAGVVPERAIACGHSVGEYNALAAIVGVLPPESVLEIVWMRGCTMHTVVERDETGRSPWRMGVIRPNLAGLDHAGAESLVTAVCQSSGRFLQIVNHNVRGSQYSVAGHVDAIADLQRALASRTRAGAKPAWILVPGIDVPFHSDILRPAVPAFRSVLEDRLPLDLDLSRLQGIYLPNLVARPFELTAEFARAIVDACGSETAAAIAASAGDDGRLSRQAARPLLIELLAWQFASPVRWIETQERLFRSPASGGLGVRRLVEVGVGYQPTLCNMARASLAAMGPAAASVEIRNAEADLDVVTERDVRSVSAPPSFSRSAAAVSRSIVGAAAAPLEPQPSAASGAASPIASGPSVSTGAAVVSPTAPLPASPDEGGTVDAPLSHATALRALLAVQARLHPSQIGDGESIEEIFQGVSSRRNQALLDIGAEFGVGAIDGAHERPLSWLIRELEQRAPAWHGPGRYLRAFAEDAFGKLMGRSGFARRDAIAWLGSELRLSEPSAERCLVQLALDARAGESARGGALASHAIEVPADRRSAESLLVSAAERWATGAGISLRRRATAAGNGRGVVDAAAVRELEERVIGKDGILTRVARDLACHLGQALPNQPAPPPVDSGGAALRVIDSEFGPEFASLVAPQFDAARRVAFTSSWAIAQRDAVQLWYDAVAEKADAADLESRAALLSSFSGDERVRGTVRWYLGRALDTNRPAVARLFENALRSGVRAPLPLWPTTPATVVREDGTLSAVEHRWLGEDAPVRWIHALSTGPMRVTARADGDWSPRYHRILADLAGTAPDFRGTVALVTGAGPGSIASEVVRHLLRGGARVVVTTSRYDSARVDGFRALWAREATPGAELHVVPFNQASMRDVDALLDWLAGEPRLFPNLLIPFAAMRDAGSLACIGGRSEAALRALLMGVERLVAGTGARILLGGDIGRRCHVLLPLSPNHGQFGGDGTYAEAKAGIEALRNRWRSERSEWGAAITLCCARIGWVRGTGLMDANDAVAAPLEEECGVRTFSTAEMAFLLTAGCVEGAREASAAFSLELDLTAGFASIPDVRAVVERARQRLARRAAHARRLFTLRRDARVRARGGAEEAPAPAVHAVGEWPLLPVSPLPAESRCSVPPIPPDRMVCIVGFGEIGPCGTSRTRFELEARDALSPAAALELAWLTGLIRWDAVRGWLDVGSGDPIDESEVGVRYEAEIRSRAGVRRVDPAVAGFDPAAIVATAPVYFERDAAFTVATREEAEAYAAADPRWTRIDRDGDAWRVTRLRGAESRAPRALSLTRRVAALLPTGFDFARLGIPRDMLGATDRVTLMALLATADAFASAGLDPEELLAHLHPSRVANTLGSGIGGMQSLRRLYLDPVLGRERQTDALQETLINVLGAYTVQSYIGSYGSMSHPVGACATAAISVEQAVDKLLTDRADFVIAGAFDDYGPEGAVGFSDMNATASSDEMESMGIPADRMSRPNDARRRGFVEAQGGGTVLLARGDVAQRLGLPVYGVVAWAGSHGDGIHRSIPAPGLGVLAAACGGADSPLGRALASHGLRADDIAVVSKHDTSTAVNDPNESELHQRIQEALGRTPGNPLLVVSQKSLTGHAKGGASAWQLAGLCQILASGTVPGNRCLESVDEHLRPHTTLCWSDRAIETHGTETLRAGLLTSLGFGHVGAICLIVHPDVFRSSLAPAARVEWEAASRHRVEEGRRRVARAMMDREPLFARRASRRFASPDGSREQIAEESRMLLSGETRLGPDARYGATGVTDATS